MATELSKGKTLVVLAIVIGCFAILWPKIFYPMFQGSVAPPAPQHQPPIRERDPAGALCCGLVFESDASSAAFLTGLCSHVLNHRDPVPHDRFLALCHRELMDKCNIDLEDVVKSDVDGAVVDRRLSSKFHGRVRAQNLTRCLEVNFGIDENLVRAEKSYHKPSDVFYPRHMRPERPPHLHPDAMHPALREKGRVLPPTRTIEKQARPGPMPGMRPPMGGAGHIVSPSPGSGGMGVLMPIYTIGIIVFFLYTMMKIMFKKPPEETQEPRIKDFHMDPDHRKYLFAEEYCSGVPGAIPEMTVKEYALLQEQQRLLLLQQQEQQRRSRSKTPEQFVKKDEELQPIEEHTCVQEEVEVVEQCANSAPATESEREEEVEPEEVAEEIIPRSAKMDTEGKPIGQWYLPPGFDGGPAGSESTDENETSPDEVELNDADERSLRLAFAALKAQKEEEVNQLKRRLEETEKAMERICRQMGNVAEKLSSSGVTELLASHLSDSKEISEAEEELIPAASEEPTSAVPEDGYSLEQSKPEVIQEVREDIAEEQSCETRPEQPEQECTEETLAEVKCEQQEANEQDVTESKHDGQYESDELKAEDVELIEEVTEVNQTAEEIEEEFNKISGEDPIESEFEEITGDQSCPVEEPVEQHSVSQCEAEVVCQPQQLDTCQIEEMIEEPLKQEIDYVQEPTQDLVEETPQIEAEAPQTETIEDATSAEIVEEPVEIEPTEDSCIETVDECPPVEVAEEAPQTETTEDATSAEIVEEPAHIEPTEDSCVETVQESAPVEATTDEVLSAEIIEEPVQIEPTEDSCVETVEECLQIEATEEAPPVETVEDVTQAEIIEESPKEDDVPQVETVDLESTQAINDTLQVVETTEEVPNYESECTPQEPTGDDEPKVHEVPVEETIEALEEVVKQEVELVEEAPQNDVLSVENAAEDLPISDAVESIKESSGEDERPVEQIPTSQLEPIQPEESQPEEVVEEVVEAHEDFTSTEPIAETLEESSNSLQPEASEMHLRQSSEERRMTVNVCGMEVAASMEDCSKMPPDLLPKIVDKHPTKTEHHESDQVPSVFLDTAIPPESHLVVSEAECSAEIVPADELELDEAEYETSPVVLSGKMTLSVIGMELNAEAPEVQAESLYKVDEPDGPRVRFPPQPTDRIFLIPVEPEEEFVVDELTDVQHSELRAEEEEDLAIDDSSIVYRPPTPPLQHLVDPEILPEESEFLTYDQLEEAGEVDIPVEEIAHPCATLEKIVEEPVVESQDVPAADADMPADIDQTLLESVESHIISAQEAEALLGRNDEVPADAVYQQMIPDEAKDEHAIIGEMVEKIRGSTAESVLDSPAESSCTHLLMSESLQETPEVVKCSFDVEKVEVDVVTEAHPPSEQEPELEKVVDDQVLPTNENVLPSDELLADPEQSDTIANMVAEGYSDFFSKTIERLESTDIEFNTSVDEDNAAAMLASDVLLQQSPTLQSALNDMVESIIAESIEDSVAESLTRQVECDTGKESEEDARVVEPSDSILMQLSDRLQDSGTVLMDVEYQIIPTSDSPSCCAEVDNGEQEQEEIEVGDFERNRELAVMEHMLEQIETPVDPVVNVEEVEAEPSISGFVIREDFPDEDEAEPMTEEEILLARQEIEEIKKLLADVSSGVVHHQDSQMPAMAEDSGTAASKGSSPDMDEYEVIQSTRPTETYECTDGAEDDSTKTSNES